MNNKNSISNQGNKIEIKSVNAADFGDNANNLSAIANMLSPSCQYGALICPLFE